MGKQILAILSLKYYTAVKMWSVAVTCDKSRCILKTILKKSYFIELQLIYNVVLKSAIQQSDSLYRVAKESDTTEVM